MFSKFTTIRNIGKFASCNAAGDVTFRKLTLIFGENGKGKTTLGDILRSLSTGNPEYILGRATLGSAMPPFAQVLLDGNNHVTFKDGKWDSLGPRIAIYDSTFIDENVHSGNHIEHDHRKNLCGVIIGEEGVVIARKVDEYDGLIREANKDITSDGNVVKAYLPLGQKLDTFIAIRPDDEIDTKIKAKQIEIASLERAKEIKDKTTLKTFPLPELPPNFDTLLAKVLDDVSKEAEVQVKHQIGTLARPGGEQWIAQGVALISGDNCPFCGQGIVGIDLIATYKKYFSEGYTAFKKELSTLQESVQTAFSETSLLRIQKTIDDNGTLGAFWSEFVTVQVPEPLFASIQKPIADLKKAALNRLMAKLSSPLEAVPSDAEFDRACEAYRNVIAVATEYGKAVGAANELIAAKKKDTETGDLPNAKNDLTGLKAVKIRVEPAVAAACTKYVESIAYKASLDKGKVASKGKLDEYCSKVVGQYEQRINALLEIFAAGFRIGETKTSYVGGKVSSSFHIVINKVPVELGDSNTPLGKACFRNTLSAGDRSTLALAFFIAKLERDPKLSDTVVLFDDPFTSQDKSRRLRTQHMITKLAATCSQVIVLSHDASFLKQINDSKQSAEVKTLQFFRTSATHSKIVECDIDELTRGCYFDNYNTLYKFFRETEGKPRLVVRAIRPLLEGYLRMKQPKEFKADEWLGDMIKRIRDAQAGSALHDAQPLLEELEALNEYSKIYHHDESAEAEGHPIDEIELQSFAGKTLAFVGGF